MTDLEQARKLLDDARASLESDYSGAAHVARAHASAQVAAGYINLHRFEPDMSRDAIAIINGVTFSAHELHMIANEAVDYHKAENGPITVTTR